MTSTGPAAPILPTFLDLVRAVGAATLESCNGDLAEDDDGCDPKVHRAEAASLLAALRADPALVASIARWVGMVVLVPVDEDEDTWEPRV